MQQPPLIQRKVKHVNALKSVQIDQTNKLLTKQQVESDLLEDLRNYTKLRSNIEREYAQATQKLSAQYLQKFPPRDLDKEELRTPFALWRELLQNTDDIAKRRLAISQVLANDIAEPIKNVKANRQQTLKKCVQLSERLHEELTFTVTDLDKTQKAYNEHQKVAIQAREQASEAEEKLRKGTVRFYQSKGKLEKTLNKSQGKKETGEKMAAISRNEYLLSLAASNAHQQRYYSIDLPELIAQQDGDIYERFKEYFDTIARLEIESNEAVRNSFSALAADIDRMQRAYAVDSFLKKNPVFTQSITYDFKVHEGDTVSTLTEQFNAGLHLNKEARKWAVRVAKEQRFIQRKNKELQEMTSTAPVIVNGEAPVRDKDALIEEIRHLEVLKCKADARIDAMRQAGINVDEWLQDAIQQQEEEERQYTENNNEGDTLNKNDFDDEWDDDDDSGGNGRQFSDDALSTTSSQGHLPCPAKAIYSFMAASREELSINDGDDLEILERDGEGWCKGRNLNGQIGFFPESYVEVRANSAAAKRSPSFDASVTSTCLIPAATAPEQQPTSNHAAPTAGTQPTCLYMVRALYGYDPMSDEELGFKEGDLIAVTNKDENGIDDGWWEGTLNGRVGVFPSLVVEPVEQDASNS